MVAATGVIVAVGLGTTFLLGVLGAARSRPAAGTRPSATSTPNSRPPSTRFQPPRVTANPTAPQSQIDSELSHAEQPTVLPAGELASLPAAGVSAAYPPVPSRDRGDATSFATAFVAELLDRDYADQSRNGLLAWAQAESAPNSLPGTQAALAGRSLVLSLADPESPGPVPTAAGWVNDAAAGQIDSVVNLSVGVDPQWLALTATGWQPADPAMTILTVTGNLIVHQTDGNRSRSFSLDLTLGSARSGPGHGAVAVDDWAVL